MVTESQRLRELPAVHEVVERLFPAMSRFPRALVVAEARRAIEERRSLILAGAADGASVEERVVAALAALEKPSLRHVVNATGVVLHTNLGRAPLGPMAALPGYSNLEYHLAAGRRGKRDAHYAPLLERLLGAPAIAVNNNAAAILLALNELAAGAAQSGAAICEVGTTNRTTVDDYRAAITARTRLLLRVHPSNFKMEGFTARPALGELIALGRERGVPVYEDLGSGCVLPLQPFGIDEPLAAESLAAGADLVSFSGDKLLGGPQAGILAGKAEIVARLRRNPLYRALRLDKLVCQALEHTLRSLILERWEEAPALAMIRLSAASIRARAEALVARTRGIRAEVVPGNSLAGGGATPQQTIPTWLIAMECNAAAAEAALRAADPPIIARIEDEKLILDLRTVFPAEEDELAAALEALAGRNP